MRFPFGPLVALATAVGIEALSAQAPTPLPTSQPAEAVFSMGQPPRWPAYVSALALSRGASFGGGALLGIRHPILNPVTGLFAVGAEAYGQWGADRSDAGLRALAIAPAFGLALGADWSVTRNDVDPVITFQTAIRRGGIVGRGSMLRVDWLPTRQHELDVGLSIPLRQPFAGRTRPRATSVRVSTESESPSSLVADGQFTNAAERALRTVARSASLIAAYTSLNTPGDQSALNASSDAGSGYVDAIRSYDEAMRAAFGAAVSENGVGEIVASRARAIVLEHVILPYDALFGQVKDARTANVLFDACRGAFARWLIDSSTARAADRSTVLGIFDRWTDIVVDVAHQSLARWHDSRFVWIPIQLALAPAQLDDQAELDRLIGRAVGHSFTRNNELAYLRTADLPLEIARSIVAARRYHVLWTHDFTGRRPSGKLDEISYTIVADAYLPALTEAVQRYDSTGLMPQYFILLDAFYYHARYGRMWMSVLESPLTASSPLRDDEGREDEHLRQRLAALHAAVAHSTRLQREAAVQGGEAWLARVIKVNVNVTLPSDFSFRSSRTLPPIPFTPDNVSRDHRKAVLYDFTEADPYAGELLVTGIGIGEHYASATWEDRGYRLRGPAALDAREMLRRTLIANGFSAGEIPEPLRVFEDKPADANRQNGRLGVASALHVANEPGFGAKRSAVARAMLYTLAPPGSDIIVADPLWLSESWAGMLLAAAARGCHVAIITPAVPNSPNPEGAVVARQHDMLQQMLTIRDGVASRIHAAGGAFHIGIYAAHAPVTDVRARFAEVRAGLARSPWIRQLIPFDSAAVAQLEAAAMQADRTDAGAILAADETPREPQLHQKTQLIARPGAIASLVRQPGWEAILARTLLAQSRENVRLADALATPIPSGDTAAVHGAEELLQMYERSLSPADHARFGFHFVVGTQNHDDRGVVLDGEETVVVSGFDAAAGLVDLYFLMARTTWVDNGSEIDRLVPPRRGLIARLARFIRLAL